MRIRRPCFSAVPAVPSPDETLPSAYFRGQWHRRLNPRSGHGRCVAVPFHDTDDYFWHPTEPPYRDRRTEAERLTLMHQMFVPRRAWVLSGSLIGWGDPLI